MHFLLSVIFLLSIQQPQAANEVFPLYSILFQIKSSRQPFASITERRWHCLTYIYRRPAIGRQSTGEVYRIGRETNDLTMGGWLGALAHGPWPTGGWDGQRRSSHLCVDFHVVRDASAHDPRVIMFNVSVRKLLVFSVLFFDFCTEGCYSADRPPYGGLSLDIRRRAPVFVSCSTADRSWWCAQLAHS